jgi:transcriptional regulator GlxA family with amidase domain
MARRLSQIQNWMELAQRSQWKIETLAQLCGVSIRTLERYFRESMGTSPAKWVRERRIRKGADSLTQSPVKVAASETGYKYSNNFSRAYRNYWGVNPKK